MPAEPDNPRAPALFVYLGATHERLDNDHQSDPLGIANGVAGMGWLANGKSGC